MTITATPTGQRIDLEGEERTLLLAALDSAVALQTGRPERAGLLCAGDLGRLDALAHALWMLGSPSIARRAYTA